jgi:aspartate aminotransferase
MAREYRARHDYLVAALDALPGIRCRPGWGTFYAFADIRDALASKGIEDDLQFADRLLVEAGLAVVPGSGFGAPGYLRLSFACSMETLHAALERLGRFLAG